jgi:hypothetical protein
MCHRVTIFQAHAWHCVHDTLGCAARIQFTHHHEHSAVATPGHEMGHPPGIWPRACRQMESLCLCAEQVGKSSNNLIVILQDEEAIDWLQFW